MTKRAPFLLGLLLFSPVLFSNPWPQAHWKDKTLHYQNQNPLEYTKLMKFIAQDPKAEHDGIVVVKNGQLAFEWYRTPQFGPNKPHIAWSITKSFVNALIGIAISEKKVISHRLYL